MRDMKEEIYVATILVAVTLILVFGAVFTVLNGWQS